MTTTAGHIPVEIWCHIFRFLVPDPVSSSSRLDVTISNGNIEQEDERRAIGGSMRTKRLGHRDWSILTRSFSAMRHAAAVCPHFVLDFRGWPLSVRDRLRDEHVEAMVTAMPMICGHVDLTLCTSLTPRALDIISSNPNLRSVTLAHTPSILGDEKRVSTLLCRLMERSANLEHLRVYNCGEGKIKVVHDLLSVEKSAAQPKGSEEQTATATTGLKSLSLQSCKINMDEKMEEVFRNGNCVAAGLTSLNLTSCGSLSWNWVCRLAKLFPSLKALDVRDCSFSDPIIYEKLGSNWNGLEVLRLRGCKGEAGDPENFSKAFPKLKVLDLTASKSYSLFSSELEKAVADGCPDLEELDISRISNNWYPGEIVKKCKKLRALGMAGELNMRGAEFNELIEDAGARLEYFGSGRRISMTIAKKLLESCPKLRVMPLAGLRSISPLFNPLPLPNQELPPFINSIESIVEKLEAINAENKLSSAPPASEEWNAKLMAQPKLVAALPDQFVEFGKCWAGRFPITADNFGLSSLPDFGVQGYEKWMVLNEYGNNDTIWLHVLDLEGKYGPKGGIIDLSSWDTHYERHNGFCDAIMDMHMTGNPDSIARDSYPIVYDDTLTFLNALLITSVDSVVGDLAMFISGVMEFSGHNPLEGQFDAISEFLRYARWSHKLLLAAVQAEKSQKELAGRVVSKIVELAGDNVVMDARDHLGRSAVDLAAEKCNLHLFK